jgi:hypothetical protein
MMQHRSMLFAALPALAAAAALGLASPAAAQSTVIIAPSAPPPVRVESVPPAPSTAMVWQPGHWAWSNSSWNWIPGNYAAPPQQMAVWDPGHWVQQPTGGYVWVEGHWHASGG